MPNILEIHNMETMTIIDKEKEMLKKLINRDLLAISLITIPSYVYIPLDQSDYFIWQSVVENPSKGR